MIPGQPKQHKPSHAHEPEGQGMERLSPIGMRYFDLIEFDDQEKLVLEIRKHLFGLFIIFLTGFLVIIATIAVSIALTIGLRNGSLQEVNAASYSAIFILVGLVLAILEGLAMLLGAYLYRSNVVFITNQKIAQVLYLTVFNRKISQLNVGDVQDVTVTQRGLFAHLFSYGTLVIETAGEQQNYTFTFVPSPYNAAKTIIAVHEKNIAEFGN